ncbi:SNF2-related protein [Candidatus Proelusimicrobium volucris]|uniref:SNF2-related protein n=1 Tax=Candidatus Proelusimicrobium volucris TaxID=3416225 RepID=UPI003D0AEC19
MKSFAKAQYLAQLLTLKNPANSVTKLGRSVLNSTIDLTPHQIDAALFAFQNPLSKGAILADEVGLGKTIEAGLVISQLWAENKRKILCITPASIRKQWQGELSDKFFIDSFILDTKTYKQCQKEGNELPFNQKDKVVICSYQYARRMERDIALVDWDLVVIDEAHRLRNVYRSDNKIARSIQKSTAQRKKLLLTATPLQNSLLELYGLVSFVDERIFGNLESFKAQFIQHSDVFDDIPVLSDDAKTTAQMRAERLFNDLKQRIAPIAHRTLRRQVQQYVRYTKRSSITIDFTPSDDELELYEKVSEYLRKPSFGVSSSNNALLMLVIRKILASSSFAISDTLGKLIERLKKVRETQYPEPDVNLAEDFESLEELQDDWAEAGDPQAGCVYPFPKSSKGLSLKEKVHVREMITDEINQLEDYRKLAKSITENAKGNALLQGIELAFSQAKQLGSPRKVLVFTESRRTQQYLKELLDKNGFADCTLTLNGTNTDPASKALLKQWKERHQTDGKITGIVSADTRAAILEEFKDRAQILLATESGAEGLNMQFCNVVVNYDLPWNPQRIEQRIGRCHRYGQNYDVVVINFLNTANAADKRVLELLKNKLNLFDGVFGSSDPVLGALESGVDIEKAIADIFQKCRTEQEIQQAFDNLQTQLSDTIAQATSQTKSKIFDNFDEDVQKRIKGLDKALGDLTQYESYMLAFLQAVLGKSFSYDPNTHSVFITTPKLPFWQKEWSGTYSLKQSLVSTRPLHLNLPMMQALLQYVLQQKPQEEQITFDYTHSGKNLAMVKHLVGKSGYLRLVKMTVSALDTTEYLLFSMCTDSGKDLTPEYAQKLFKTLPVAAEPIQIGDNPRHYLLDACESRKKQVLDQISQENSQYFDAEMDKLDQWADDLKNDLEREIKDLDKEIKALKKLNRETTALQEKLSLGRQQKEKEDLRRQKRARLFDEQDEISRRKDHILDDLQQRLQNNVTEQEIFIIGWKVI